MSDKVTAAASLTEWPWRCPLTLVLNRSRERWNRKLWLTQTAVSHLMTLNIGHKMVMEKHVPL